MSEFVLNLMNRLAEDEAEYLREKADDESAAVRSMDLYFSHNNRLSAIGYNDKQDIIWFSNTELNDMFLSRRIFDCVKYGSFHRRATLEKVLATAGMVPDDLQSMCYAHLEHMEAAHPVFSGCIVSSENQEEDSEMTGVEFSHIVAVLPQRLRTGVSNLGSDDDIIAALERDYQLLEAVSVSDEIPSSEKKKTAEPIINKWRGAECLKMSDRAAIRTLYRDVIYHRCSGDN